jgi:predicted RNase H-like HicB family nuclease
MNAPALINIETWSFNEGPVATGQAPLGDFVAYEPKRPEICGRGPTRWSAIADLNEAIEAASCEDEDEEHPLTGQNAIEASWDHERKLRAEESL